MTRRRGLRLSVLLVAAAFTALAGLVGQAGLAALDRTEGWQARLGGEMTVAIRATEPAAVADISRCCAVLSKTGSSTPAGVLTNQPIGRAPPAMVSRLRSATGSRPDAGGMGRARC